jgi:hypothetical protein
MAEQLFWWSLMALFAFGGLSSVSDIGKPRTPMSHSTAVTIVIVDALLILGVVHYGLGW